MSTTILVKAGQHWYKARVNPLPKTQRDLEEYARFMRTYVRQSKRGKLASMIRVHRRILKLEKKLQMNPLVSSTNKRSVGTNIKYLMTHQKELTAKTPEMRRKQAIAIALSVWRRAKKKVGRK